MPNKKGVALKGIVTDEVAVSHVISVILLIAVVTLLASVVGTFAFDLGEDVRDRAPQASFDFEYNESASELTITHTGGERIPAREFAVTDGTIVGCDTPSDWSVSEKVSPGDSCTYTDADAGETIRVNWDKEGKSVTLVKWDGPDV